MRRSIIVDTTVGLVFHSALVLSTYLLFTGHNQPGGGFVGGLAAAAAFALVYVAGGIEDVRRLSRFRPWTVLGSGLLLATSVAIAPTFLGSGPLSSDYVEATLPVLGEVKVVSTLLFDIGVYGVVIGIALMVLEAFGESGDPATDPEVS